MKRGIFIKTMGLLGLSASLPAQSIFAELSSQNKNRSTLLPFSPDLDHLRKLADVIAGKLPDKIHVTKVADTIRPSNVVVEGADPNEKMTLARTVYQLVYENGTIMLDSGMDYKTHKTFGITEEPFYHKNFESVQKALLNSNLIVFSHYHADHVGGVVTSDKFDSLAHKVWLSKATADFMVNKPHKETVKISRNQVEKMIITDFELYYPLAPGLVIFKSPGHTPDSTMFYIKLSNGQEYIHSVDSGWSMKNITEEKMKNASWVNENESQLLEQYKWLNKVMKEEKDLVVLCTHDNEQYYDFIKKGFLKEDLYI